MRDISDLDHFVLQPGETLILRPRKAMSTEQIERLHHMLKQTGLKILLLAPEIDVMAGHLELIEPDAPDPEAEDDNREQIQEAYESGRIIEYKPIAGDDEFTSQWISAHRTANPHAFDWGLYRYRLPG